MREKKFNEYKGAKIERKLGKIRNCSQIMSTTGGGRNEWGKGKGSHNDISPLLYLNGNLLVNQNSVYLELFSLPVK